MKEVDKITLFLCVLGAAFGQSFNCSQGCYLPPENVSEACNFTTGECLSGCLQGYFGYDCSLQCPVNCASAGNDSDVCDFPSGHCRAGCIDGYEGLDCSTVKCPVNCSSGLDNELLVCDNVTHNCLYGCKRGYAGHNCSVQCPENCAEINGNESEICNGETMACKFGISDTCNASTGECFFGCVQGYAGSNCSHKCPQNCGIAPAGNAETCNFTSGDCLYGCLQGFAGENCSYKCSDNCLSPSDNNSHTCNTSDNSCLHGCQYGFTGNNCLLPCPKNCVKPKELNSQTCNASTLECLHGCENGYAGQNCTVKCPDNCQRQPQEDPSAICNALTEDCLFGCKEGYVGSQCNDACKTTDRACTACQLKSNISGIICTKCLLNFYLLSGSCKSCPNWCGASPGIIYPNCNSSSGECLYGCQKGKRGQLCDQRCDDNCNNQTCDQYTGNCVEGCISSRCGLTCQTSCNEGCKDRVCSQTCNCEKGCYLNNWGEKCDETCSDNCNKSNNSSNICERSDGYCIYGCMQSKWWGRQCNKLCSKSCEGSICNHESGTCINGCTTNTVYGETCDQPCSENCFNGTCLREDGFCTEGCNSKWYGDRCDKKCSENCVDGVCDRTNANCSCELRWYGETCEKICSNGCYGSACDASSGNCTYGCIPQYEGPTCDKLSPITTQTSKDSPREMTWIYVVGGGCGLIIIAIIAVLVMQRRERIARDRRMRMSEDELAELSKKREDNRQRGVGARLSRRIVENPLFGLMMTNMRGPIQNTKFHVSEVLERVVQMDFSNFFEEFQRLPSGLTRSHSVSTRLENLALNFYSGIYPYDENRVVLKRAPDLDVQTNQKKMVKRVRSIRTVRFSIFGKDNDGYITMKKEPVYKTTPQNKTLKSALKRSNYEEVKDVDNPRTDLAVGDNTNPYESVESAENNYANKFENARLEATKDKPNDYVGFQQQTKDLDTALDPFNNAPYDSLDGSSRNQTQTSELKESSHLYDKENTMTRTNGKETTNRQVIEEDMYPPSYVKYTVVQKKHSNNNEQVKINSSGTAATFSKTNEKGDAPFAAPGTMEGTTKKEDYINASWIKINKDDHKFIAAQAPLKLTVDDFWLMIWEQRVEMVVMLVANVENGLAHCEQYWPEKGQSATYGDMVVQTESDESLVNYSIRNFNLSMHGVERDVVQLQFKAWPGESCPVSAIDLIQFHQKYRSMVKILRLSSPIVVHCTAGVGRTGVFIALDTVYEEGRDTGMIDVFSCVARLREQRVDMVNSCEQYEFLYKAVAQTFALECVPYNKNKIREKLSDLKKFNDQGISRLEVILKKMKTALQLDTQNIAPIEQVQERRSKDRPTSDIPDVVYRARLPKNMYINAVLVDTLRDKESMVATQMTTPDTLTDFCQLVMSHHIETIVMLNVVDMNDKTIGFYWPRDDEKVVMMGTFKMTATEVGKPSDFEVRKLRLESVLAEDNEPGREITLIQFKGWKVVQNLPSVKNLVKLLLMARQSVNESKERKLLVHCLNGSDQSGLFCALYNLLETLDLEDEVSITTIVRQIMARRPGAIPELNQLEVCFTTAIQYITQKY